MRYAPNARLFFAFCFENFDNSGDMPLKTGKRLTVNLDDDVAAGAEERAKNMRCSMSDYVNRLILADLMERAGILLTEHGALLRAADRQGDGRRDPRAKSLRA